MTIYRSLYTLTEPFDPATGIVMNTLTGACDIVGSHIVLLIKQYAVLEYPSSAETEWLLQRGYYVHSLSDEALFAKALASFSLEQARSHRGKKYVFSVNLDCNLSCEYCWQVQTLGASRRNQPLMSDAMLEAAFTYIDEDRKDHQDGDAMVSVFGGEPLIDTPAHHHLIRHIGTMTKARGLTLHFTTNGKEIEAFSDEIAQFSPSIQVTVDDFIPGNPGVLVRNHEPLKGLIEFLQAASKASPNVIAIRYLCEPDTVAHFRALADHLYAHDGDATPLALAVAPIQNKAGSTQRTYASKLGTLKAVLRSLEGTTYSRKISFLDWRSLLIVSHLKETDPSLPFPSFVSCEANTHLVCFDHVGNIYACYEAIGDPQFVIGRYWPAIAMDTDVEARYRDRSPFAMPQCARCSLSPLCGGGCQVRSAKKFGTYNHPYCAGLKTEVQYLLQNWRSIQRAIA